MDSPIWGVERVTMKTQTIWVLSEEIDWCSYQIRGVFASEPVNVESFPREWKLEEFPLNHRVGEPLTIRTA